VIDCQRHFVGCLKARTWSKAWHNWALFNVATMEHYVRSDTQRAQQHVAPAVLGFFRSVALGQAVGGIRTNSGTLQVRPCAAFKLKQTACK
jgi:hypothetical protein